MIGTVWLITRYGSRARSNVRKRTISTASAMPSSEPATNASSAQRNEYHAARITTTKIVSVPPRTSGSPKRANMSQMCGMARSSVRARTRTPSTSPPFGGPTAL